MFKRSDCKTASRFLGRLAHPTRLEILCCLLKGPTPVGKLTETLSQAQPTVSQFLSRMQREGLIQSERQGRSVYYSIKDKRIFLLMKNLRKVFCQ